MLLWLASEADMSRVTWYDVRVSHPEVHEQQLLFGSMLSETCQGISWQRCSQSCHRTPVYKRSQQPALPEGNV